VVLPDGAQAGHVYPSVSYVFSVSFMLCFSSSVLCVEGEKLDNLLSGLCTLLPQLSASGGRESMLRGRGIVCLACNRGSNGGPWFYQ
jgi:hypothetical protein